MSNNKRTSLDIAVLASVRLPISAELDTIQTTPRELLSLELGRVLTLTKATGDNVEIYIGNVLFASGEVVVSEGMLGVRIAELRGGGGSESGGVRSDN